MVKSQTNVPVAQPNYAPRITLTGYLRLAQIVGNPKADPPIQAILPISRSTFLAGVKNGRYKLTPCKLSQRCTAYKVEEVMALLESFTGEVQ